MTFPTPHRAILTDLPRQAVESHHRLTVEKPLRIVRDLRAEPSVHVGDIAFTATTFDKVIEWLLMPARPEQGVSVRLSNAYCVAHARKSRAYLEIMQAKAVNLPDGTPVTWAMRFALRRHGLEFDRVRGPSLFTDTLRASAGSGARHYFLGGSPTTIDKLRRTLEEDFPGATVAGLYSPPFAPLDEITLDDWARRIRNSGATVVWVGLGSPKQDFATTRLADTLGMHCVGVGAAFDFLAGTQSEAPTWMQRYGLEWLFRLGSEPRRLWKRYVFGNCAFIYITAKQIPAWWKA